MTHSARQAWAPAIMLVAAAWGALIAAVWPLPAGVLGTAPIESVAWVDRHGRLLGEQVGAMGARAEAVELREVSPHFIAALLAAEDQRFYRHHGIDPLAVVRALGQNVRAGRVVSGGSTLTQQLARLLLGEQALLTGRPLPARSLLQKLREARLALRLELHRGKAAILAAFLNRAPFGNNAIGLRSAAARYFGVSPGQLTVAQAAYLAALPKGPSAFSARPEDALDRQRHILRRMRESGAITPGQLDRARHEQLRFVRAPGAAASAQHAVSVARQVLSEQGREIRGTVQLTIDQALQADAARLLDEQIPRVYGRGGRSGAAVVIDNASGDVLAMVGAAFEENPRWGQYNAALATRQPGSALKPFIYAAALARGFTAASLAADVYRPYPDTWGVYMPENYDQRYHGPVRFRDSLAQSLNVAAVDVLFKTGLANAFHLLDAVGLKTLDRRPSFFGLGLALGSGGVRLIDLANAYATLARGGVHRPWRIVSEAGQGEAEEHAGGQGADGQAAGGQGAGGQGAGEQAAGGQAAGGQGEAVADARVIDQRVAYIVSSILADAGARTPQFGPRSVLTTPYWTAVKTGTSKGFRDNWTVGFTRDVTVGVWVGDPSGKPMHHMSGVEGAGIIWRRIMNRASGYASRPPPEPPGLVHRRICAVSGKLVGADCPGGLDEVFVAGTEPHEACTMHRRARIDPQNGLLVPPGCVLAGAEERLVTVYPAAFAAWADDNEAGVAERYSPRCPPPGQSSQATARAAVRLLSPAPTETLHIDVDAPPQAQALLLAVEVEGWSGPITYEIDGKPFKTVEIPYEVFWPLRPGSHRFSARIGVDGPRSAEHLVVVH